MHLTKRDRARSSRSAVATAAGALAALAGCATIAAKPEIAPDRYAPPAADQPWSPPADVAAEYAVPSAEQVPDHVPPSQPAAAAPAAPAYGLAALIDISLTNNPA